MNTAKLFMNGKSQAVRLPKEYRFRGDRVYIKKVGNAVVLLPIQDSWQALLNSLDRFTPDFMEDRAQPPHQKRKSPFEMRYLLDTNVCIDIIRKKPAYLLNRLAGIAVGEVGVSVVTIAELHYGAQKSRHPETNQQALADFLLPLAIVEFDRDAALAYGNIRAALEARGRPIGALDMLIAAQAVSLNLTLVTHNRREFERIPQLQVGDWTRG